MEDSKVDLLKLKLEEVTKQRNFFWDSFILSIALFISGLSLSGIIAELFSGENSVGCYYAFHNRIVYNFFVGYCYKDIPNIKYFPVIVLSQSALLFAPHYCWKAIFSAKIESFLSHAAKVEILREKDTGKYPYHNYTIVKYLRREFSDSYSISFSYILKLAVQLVSVIISFFINWVLFIDIYNKDITFMCKDDDQLFDLLFAIDNTSLDRVICTYPRKVFINVLVWIDYLLIFLASMMLIYGLIWVLRNHSKKNHNYTIASFCYNSCIDPQYCYKLSKEIYFQKDWFQIRDDFTFLLASLHSGYRRVFKTIIIEDIISRKFSKDSKKLIEEDDNHTKNCFCIIKEWVQALCLSLIKCVLFGETQNDQDDCNGQNHGQLNDSTTGTTTLPQQSKIRSSRLASFKDDCNGQNHGQLNASTTGTTTPPQWSKIDSQAQKHKERDTSRTGSTTPPPRSKNKGSLENSDYSANSSALKLDKIDNQAQKHKEPDTSTTGSTTPPPRSKDHYTSLSEFIPTLCKDITKTSKDKSNLVILDIASGYHSYLLDISNSCEEKVVSVILGSHHERKIETIENTIVISMKTALNKPKGTEMEFTDELKDFIGGKLNLMVVGPLDSEHKQSTVNQIVNNNELFENDAVMLVIKVIKLGKKIVSDNFFDCNPNMSRWRKYEFEGDSVIKQWIDQSRITKQYEMTVNYKGYKCDFQLKSYIFKSQGFEKNNQPSSSSCIPVPIHNTGNICYLISVIQNLRNCEQLRNCYELVISGNTFKKTYTISKEKIEVDCPVKPFTAALWEILNATERNELETWVKNLLELMGKRNDRFAEGTEQDSHEALRLILDALSEEEIDSVKEAIRTKFGRTASSEEEHSQLKDYLRQAVEIQTVVDKVFGGKTLSTVVCRECDNVSQKSERQLDFSLPISDETSVSKEPPENDSLPFSEDHSKLRTHLKEHNFYYQYLEKNYAFYRFTINQCLESFTTLDVLDKDNKKDCKTCTQESLCSKQLLVYSPPKVLVLHLKRFHNFPSVTKNDKRIKFELMLNMAPFCTNNCFEGITQGKEADDSQDSTSGKVTPIIADKAKKIVYALKGVIVHNGSLQSGHYYTFLRTTETTEQFQADCNSIGCYDESADYKGKWYCANDSEVTDVSEKRGGIPEKVKNSEVYLLFYELLPLKSSNND